MIYTVTFNPSLDYIVDVPTLKMGRINRTSGEKIFPGGKGINVSIVLNNLGIENRALGYVAGFTGDAIRNLLKEKGVQTDFIQIRHGMSRINVKLRSGEETEINGNGPHISPLRFSELCEKLNYLDSEDYLVLAGSIPASLSKSTYMDIMKMLEGKGIRIVVDATNELLMNVLPYKPFLVKPNIGELGEIFGVTITGNDEVIEYATKLKEMGARNVLVSMGGDGAIMLAEDGNIYQSKAPKGEVKNSVGAGDSMLAGFLAGYIESENYESAFKMGLCAGSASAFSEELATRDEVMRLLKGEK